MQMAQLAPRRRYFPLLRKGLLRDGAPLPFARAGSDENPQMPRAIDDRSASEDDGLVEEFSEPLPAALPERDDRTPPSSESCAKISRSANAKIIREGEDVGSMQAEPTEASPDRGVQCTCEHRAAQSAPLPYPGFEQDAGGRFASELQVRRHAAVDTLDESNHMFREFHAPQHSKQPPVGQRWEGL